MPLPIQVTMVFMRAMFVVMLMLDCLVCVYGVRVEDRSEYLHRQPGWLHPPVRSSPSPPCSVCEHVTRSPSLSGWACWGGTQGPEQPGAHGHHPDERGPVDELDHLVRFLPHSTLRVVLNDGEC
jgi:hypothetical protein